MMPRAPADDQRDDQRRCAELDGDRQADAEQFGHGEVRQIVARPEIAVEQIAEIEQILLPQRLIEVEDAVEIGLDDGIQAAFLVEGSAGRHADQEKRDRHDHEERRNGGQQTAGTHSAACAHPYAVQVRRRRSRQAETSELLRRPTIPC